MASTGSRRSGPATLTIGVIGLGHVGLPTALSFAELGWDVIGVDSAPDRVRMLGDGRCPFFEPELEGYLTKHLDSGGFRLTADVAEAVTAADVLFMCVGTPHGEDGAADLSQVETVVRSVARHMSGYKLVVEKSTSPVRTAERIKQTLRRYGNGSYQADVAVNPEFMQEGTAFHDILHPDRIILGVDSLLARQLLEHIYRPLLDRLPKPGECEPCDRLGRRRRKGHPVIVTNLATAELIKHTANAFLATKISFINMIADLCEATGADVMEVAHGIGLDPRIGPHFLRAGIGFGGYCLPKDLRALARIGHEYGLRLSLLDQVASINEQRIDRFCDQIRGALWVIRGKTIGVLGLAFKSGTDDLREAPSLKIIARLLAEGASLRVHDPRALDNLHRVLPEQPGRVIYCRAPYDVATGASGLLVLTEWDEYRTLDLARIREVMEVPILFDGRNLYDPLTVRSFGFEYHGVGRQTQGPAYPAATAHLGHHLPRSPRKVAREIGHAPAVRRLFLGTRSGGRAW